MKEILMICLLVFFELLAKSQTFLMPVLGTDTITTCGGKLYDSGGPNGNYSDNSDAVLYIEPNNANSLVTLQVNQLETESCCDYLAIYPNANPQDPGSQKIAQINDYYLSEDDNGKVALRYYSDGGVAFSGFEISIGCLITHDTVDLSFSNTIIPDSAVLGDSLRYKLSILNDFTQNINDVVVIKIYLNQQNDLLTAFLIDSVIVNNLPRGIYNTDLSTILSDTITAGNYYIFVVIDANNTIEERNELNNVYTGAIQILQPEINLEISHFNYVGEYFSSGLSSCLFRVTSTGNTICDSWGLSGYLSKTRDFRNNSIEVGSLIIPSYDNYYSASVLLFINDSVQLSDSIYYLSLNLKPECGIDETDTSDNLIQKQVIVSPCNIDLGIINLMTNKKFMGGESSYAYYTCYSDKIFSNMNSEISFYLSEDTIPDNGNDTLLQTNIITWYGQNYEGSAALTYPSNKNGNFYLLCVIDHNNRIKETNKNNNCFAWPVMLLSPNYDLEMLKSSIRYNDTSNYIESSIQYKNAGGQDIWAFNTGYYLSSDSIPDAGDLLLNTNHIYINSTGYTNEYQTIIYLNNGVNPLNKYLITILDNDNNFSEINELNNYSVNLITDQVLTDSSNNFNYRSRKTIIADSGLIFDNGGIFMYSNNSSDTLIIIPATENAKLSLRVNNILLEDGYDYLSVYYGIISDSTTATFVQNITSSSQTYRSNDPTGAISLIFRSNGSVTYSGFELSFDTLSSVNHSDIEIKQFALNNNVYINGEYLKCQSSVGIKNLEGSGIIYFGYYLSTDPILDPSDTLLATNFEYYFYDEVQFKIESEFYLPSNLDLTTYYIICKADYDNSFIEDNENNNIKTKEIKIVRNSLDLSIGFCNDPLIVFANNTNQVQVDIKVNGRAETSGTMVSRLYLSHDKIMDTTDVFLSENGFYLYNSYMGDIYSGFSFTISDTIEKGFYYLIPVINEGFIIGETDSTNNTSYIPVAIVKENNDLVLLSNIIPDTIFSRYYLQKTYNVTNIGDTKASGYSIKLVLSKDKLMDNSDITLYDYLDQNTVHQFNMIENWTTIDMSGYIKSTDTGRYYLISLLSSYPSIENDINLTNNSIIDSTYIKMAHYDLQVNINTISDKLVKGNYYYFSFILSNIGNDPCYMDFIEYTTYLSEDTIIDANDYKNSPVKASMFTLFPYSNTTLYDAILPPANIIAGNYYLVTKIESDDENATNDISFAPVEIIEQISEISNIENSGISLYPNPVSDKLTISLSNPDYRLLLNIYSVNGELLYSYNIKGIQTTIDMDNFNSGCYILKIITSDGVMTNKIIKR
jgi:trimeric autotransporter adhesin